MKTYSIGRDASCDIVINDNTDIISRRHATLTVSSMGKMTITDHSQNGTYVNGKRIAPNTPVPVTRKQNVSLAHVANLPWDMVPRTITPLHYAALALLAIVAVLGIIFGLKKCNGMNNSDAPKEPATVVDSTLIKENEKLSETIKMLEDTLGKVKNDTIIRQLRDSLTKVKAQKDTLIAKQKANVAVKPKSEPSKDKKKPVNEKKKEPAKKETPQEPTKKTKNF